MSSTVTEHQPTTKRQRRQAQLAARRDRRERERKDRDKSLLQNGAIALAFFGLLLAVTFTLDPHDASYGKAHGTLLVMSVAAGLLLIIMRESLGDIGRSLQQALAPGRTVDVHEKALVLFGVIFLVAAATVLFVVDYGAFASTGIRIGGVVGVLLVKLARTAVGSLQR